MHDSTPYTPGLKCFVYRCAHDHTRVSHGEWRSDRDPAFGFGSPPDRLLCIERTEDGTACGSLARYIRDDTPIATQ